MRLITGADILDFYEGSYDLLILDADGEFTGADHDDFPPRTTGDLSIEPYAVLTTTDGTEVQVLLERSTITGGDWYPDALNEDGHLDPAVADDMAKAVNDSAGLHIGVAVSEVRQATTDWERAVDEANQQALRRAQLVDALATLAGGQSAAARLLDMDKSTVNKLIRKARVAR